MPNKKKLIDLKNIVTTLRGDSGCPWDKKQTPPSLIKYIREETEELIEGIESGDVDNIMEELGDVLYLLLMVNECFEEKNQFFLEDVISNVSAKLIRRHPHVFGTSSAHTEDELKKQWEEIKSAEKTKV